MLKWQHTRRNKRSFLTFVVIVLFLIVLFGDRQDAESRTIAGRIHEPSLYQRSFNPLLSQHAQLWRSLHQLILNNHPHCNKKPDLVVPRNSHVSYNAGTDHPRPDVLWMDEVDISRMKSAHSNFVTDIRALPNTLVFTPGKKGIVTTASEGLLAILAISLRMLRKTQCSLPVEIFLNRRSPYTDEFCARVFPQLGAECRYLSDIFEQADTNIHITTYQYKVFAILFSSFEDVLLLDSDAWPVTNPESLFHSLPFTDSGMVLWPDFWYASESPYFFDIAKIMNPPLLNARPATESGEILYNKPKHALSIMLATYYNYYGPDYYYLLQSQGGPGQGDKETFPWAATALDEDFYFVHQPVQSLGRHDSTGEYVGTAMIQFDPVQDFFYSAKLPLAPVKDPNDIAHPTVPITSPPKPLFVHANFPKFDPYTIFNDQVSGTHTPTMDSNGKLVRCWMPKDDAVALFGFDVEKRFWEAMQEAACGDLVGLWLGGGRPDKAAMEQVKKRDMLVCERVRDYYAAVFDTKAAL